MKPMKKLKMKTKHYFIILAVLTVFNLFIGLRPRKEVQSLNYDLYKYKFQAIQKDIDSLKVEINYYKNQTDSIKLKFVTDEKIIRNASNSDIDSMFRDLFKSR